MSPSDPETTQILVRKLDLDVRDRLRERARAHGVSMEEEARNILRAAVLSEPAAGSAAPGEPEKGWATRFSEMFAEFGLTAEDTAGWDQSELPEAPPELQDGEPDSGTRRGGSAA